MAKKNENATPPKPKRLCEAGDNLEIWQVHYTAVREQDLNARVMPPEMLERLTETIRNENRIESLPFGVLREKYIELVSGHHRIRAAVAAGVTEFPVLVDTRNLDESAIKAKQLAHNAISGRDDAETLQRIFQQITSVEARLEAFIDVTQFEDDAIRSATATLNEEVEIEWPVLSIAFLPLQMERMDALAERLARQIPKDADQLWTIPESIAEHFADTLNRLGKEFDIRTNGNILAKMVEITTDYLNQIEAEKAEQAEQDNA